MKKELYSVFLVVFLLFSGASLCFASEPQTYSVRRGDNLWDIARKFRLGVDELKEINGLKSSRIKPGQALIVGAGGGEPVLKKPASVGGASAPADYRVKKGDNLYRLSKRFHLSVKELKALNGLESNRLAVGQRLALLQPPAQPNEEPLSAKEGPVALLEETALETAGGGTVAAAGLAEASPETSPVQRLLFAAGEMLGTPYLFGGNSLRGLDCSAFVRNAFTLVGIALPRTAKEQYRVGEAVERVSLKEGDLVFFKTYARFPSHVGIYIGSNLFIHASRKLGRVAVESLDTPYYSRRFAGAKRLPALGVTDPLSIQ